ncbi:MAG: hypothetical protein EOO61_12625 [Hymenobacter sp.]|nr:MAG: hypothetical protein EOO61_12625 [Hymenobacter sp.]
MIFGNKELFAIEAYLTQGKNSVFMQYCYWIRDSRVGELDQYMLLSPTVDNFNQIIRHQGERSVAFASSDINKLMNLLIELYNDSALININYSKGENMDGYVTYLIETESYDWLVCKDTILNRIHNIKIPKNQFYTQVKNLLFWIRESTALVLKGNYTD